MVEEVTDRLGVKILQVERSDAASRALRDELEEQLQSVPIGTNRVLAGAALAWQILDEERLDERKQRSRSSGAHRGRRECRRCASKRLLANSSSCGVALR